MRRRELLVSLVSTAALVVGLAGMLGAFDKDATAKAKTKKKKPETITTTTLGNSPGVYEVQPSGDTPHRPPATTTTPKPAASPK